MADLIGCGTTELWDYWDCARRKSAAKSGGERIEYELE
jgi:hypothetical protein